MLYELLLHCIKASPATSGTINLVFGECGPWKKGLWPGMTQVILAALGTNVPVTRKKITAAGVVAGLKSELTAPHAKRQG
jgi:hypothetical protein